jgi:hypothetical protein
MGILERCGRFHIIGKDIEKSKLILINITENVKFADPINLINSLMN